jgi:hypothetical protein
VFATVLVDAAICNFRMAAITTARPWLLNSKLAVATGGSW